MKPLHATTIIYLFFLLTFISLDIIRGDSSSTTLSSSIGRRDNRGVVQHLSQPSD